MANRMSRRKALETLGWGATAALSGAALTGCRSGPRPPAASRPNILFITTDYQCGADGPSLGHSFLDMPALDRLCREGAVFERYYSTAPICMPARYTLITGTYPHTHGAWGNVSHWVPEGSPILMELLKEAGYHTVGVGKMHFHPWDRMAGYDRRIIADRKGNNISDRDRLDDYAKLLARHGLTRWDYLKLQWSGDIFGVYDWPHDPALHIDAFVGAEAAGVIEREELPEPWFLWVSFNGPHNPWDPPAEFSRPYLDMDLPVGKTFPGELGTKPLDHTRLRYNYTREVVDRLDSERERRTERLRRIRAGHYGGLTFIDRQLERIFGALERRGRLDDTVVIYSSDHGSQLGDHDLIHKGVHYDASARVPFVVRWPGRVRPRRIDAFAGHVDVFPTILALAGAAAPPSTEGLDLTPLLLGRARSVRDHALIEIVGGYSIVTDGWKLGYHPKDGDGDLYDLEKDPDELNNLFDDPAHAAVRDRLLERLKGENPAFSAAIEAAPAPPIDPPTHFVLGFDETVPPSRLPFPGEKTIRIRAVVEGRSGRPADGVIVSQMTGGGPHGWALFIDEGRAALALKVWGETVTVRSPDPLRPGRVDVEAAVHPDGRLALQVDGRPAASGRAPSGWPRQPGREIALPRERLRARGSIEAAVPGESPDPSLGRPFDGLIHELRVDFDSGDRVS